MIYEEQVSCLIPYRIRDGVVEVFLQKRSADQRWPGKFGFFGGHIKSGETPEQALHRELWEELEVDISTFPYEWLGEFPFQQDGEHRNKHIWYLKTEDDFRTNIKIIEGESGQWLNKKDYFQLENRFNHDGDVLEVFFDRMQ